MSAVRYFAYGSNMQDETFRRRRGIEPLSAVSGELAGWRLVVDKPPLVPMGESFATIVPDPTATVYGVLYEITEKGLARVDLTEGVQLGVYERIEVAVRPLDQEEGAAVNAFTLTSGERDPSMQPSERYMALMIDGAVEHGLPDEYVAFLRSIPSHPETPEALKARRMIDKLLKSLR